MPNKKATKNKKNSESSLNRSKGSKQLYQIIIFIVVFGLVLAAFLLINQKPVNSSLSFNPASGQYKVGDTITVTVSESSSVSINTISADINYDTNQLKHLNSSCTAPFTLSVPQPPAGSVHLICSVPGSSVKDSQTVGTISFKVLADTSSSQLSFAPSSQIISSIGSKNIWHGNSNNAEYTLVP